MEDVSTAYGWIGEESSETQGNIVAVGWSEEKLE
jgi:hypothetical protein